MTIKLFDSFGQILKHHITWAALGINFIFAFLSAAFALTCILLLWLGWFASGDVIDLT